MTDYRVQKSILSYLSAVIICPETLQIMKVIKK